MLKFVVLLSVALLACSSSGQMRTQEEVDGLRSFLENSKQGSQTTLEENMALNPKASPWENSGKFEGDIVLMDEQIEDMVAEYSGQSTEDRNAMINRNHHWPSAIIYFDIAAGFTQAQLNMIQNAANWFSQNTCVRWVRRTNQNDFVWITNNQDGCYAVVGYWRNWGRHTLNLANGCFNVFIVIHEMLHSAGFHHMHQSFARYDWVRINWNNIINGMQHNFNIHQNNVVTMLNLPYEYASNQHYGAWSFSSNGQPTIVATRAGGNLMGQLTHMTRYDTLRLARLYNCPGSWSVQVNEEDMNEPLNEEFTAKMRSAAEEELRAKGSILHEEEFGQPTEFVLDVQPTAVAG